MNMKKAFFDKRAEEWDEMNPHDSKKLERIVKLLLLQVAQTVLDVGSGTGIMTPYLQRYLGEKGTIIAVDYSDKMIEVSKQKYPPREYPNVKFLLQDVNEIPLNQQYDAILCYSCFPHFIDQKATIQHLAKGLKNGGRLMIAHSEGRSAINNLHKDAGEEVSKDFLPPIKEIAKMMESAGLTIILEIDNDEIFIIMAKKTEC